VGAIAFAIAAIAIGGVFVVFGFLLLVALAAAGLAIGTGVLLYRRITGRLPRFLRGSAPPARRPSGGLEVFPDDPGGESGFRTRLAHRPAPDDRAH
jgi:hypothetical protein